MANMDSLFYKKNKLGYTYMDYEKHFMNNVKYPDYSGWNLTLAQADKDSISFDAMLLAMLAWESNMKLGEV